MRVLHNCWDINLKTGKLLVSQELNDEEMQVEAMYRLNEESPFSCFTDKKKKVFARLYGKLIVMCSLDEE